jgi:hypothetical protein
MRNHNTIQIVKALENVQVENQKLKKPKEDEYGADINVRNILQERRNLNDLKRKAEIQIGDTSRVKIKTAKFGKQYAKGVR